MLAPRRSALSLLLVLGLTATALADETRTNGSDVAAIYDLVGLRQLAIRVPEMPNASDLLELADSRFSAWASAEVVVTARPGSVE